MSVNPIKIKSLWESRQKQSNGAKRFVNEMKHMLGLCDELGNAYKDKNGQKEVRNQQISPEQFSLRALAEGLMGDYIHRFADPGSTAEIANLNLQGQELEAESGSRFAEAVGAPVDASAYAAINAFTAVTGGLIEVRVLESFKNPSFIGDSLVKTIDTRLNGQKMISMSGLGPRSARRAPGEQFPRAQPFGRYVQTPELYENALAVDVTREAVLYDLSNDLLRQCSEIGYWLGYQRELDILNAVIGGSAAPIFNWNGSNYTYYSDQSATLGFNSVLSANPLQDWVSLQNCLTQLYRNSDPDLKTRLLIQPNLLLVTQAQVPTANLILNATMTERRTAPIATGAPAQTNANPLNVSNTPSNPMSGMFNVVTSPLLEQQLVEQGVSSDYAKANQTFFLIDTSKAFAWMSGIPLTTQTASANNYNALNQGLVASYFSFYRGTPAVISPWHIIKSYNT